MGSNMEASDVLAAALEQMDGIIASTKFDFHLNGSSETNGDSWLTDKHSMEKSSTPLLEDLRKTTDNISVDSSSSEVNVRVTSRSQVNGYLPETTEDRVRRLEADKASLSLQVSVLGDQVEAQSEKIRDMEQHLDDRRNRLITSEEMLQAELLTRTSLETHKLDLMAEISSLKIKLATADKDRRELDDRLRSAQRQITELEAKNTIKEAEICDLRSRLGKNGTIISPESGGDVSRDSVRERTLDRLKRKQTEVEKLKKAVDSLMIANDDKDRKLDDMKRLLKRYRRVEELLVQAQGRKAVDELLINEDDTSSTSSSTTPSVGDAIRENSHYEYNDSRHYLASPSATSTPVHAGDRIGPNHYGTPTLPPNTREALGMTRSNSCENVAPAQQKTPSTSKKKGGATDTVGYAHTEVVTDDEDGLQHLGHGGNMAHDKKKRGLRRLFGKLKRSSSQDFDGDRDGEFRRGGVRATATARLGWSKDLKGTTDLDIPFARWDGDRVTAWMNDIGLNMYVVDCKRWVRNGEQLLRASTQDLEKEMGMKNCLHRKKLQLALQAIGSETTEKLGELDHNWVARWLDDIGLPQYKDSFYDARVDGRMLHYMTVEDLLALRVSNELHHISIKRGIQVLRINGFNQQCLKRRPSAQEGHLMNIAGEVALWTNHRVMEWLRTIDLSEYAPNMRGSAVHGAIMVLEPRFNAELFAQLLSIPTSKTLLRRHLNTHFVSLIGPEVQQKKREFEASTGYITLMPSNKIKKGKFGIFGHKRSKSETEADGFICPMDISSPVDKDRLRNGTTNGTHDPKTEKAVKEIGAFSKEINSLTNMLAHDRFFENVQTSNV
ncbi:liprin-beta-2-like isoform X4 [Haliotis rufescens]|uniref:liprin-beta-2-like isoform X4 n=1 Tax=Haliotis rufescens TaxID=6454 RepID=UPI001EB01680|nr:liprin-beta-2-like isoform X4 [Haliotis rufescens]